MNDGIGKCVHAPTAISPLASAVKAALAAALLLTSSIAVAQDSTPPATPETSTLDTVSVLGSRTKPRTVSSSAVPIDIISGEEFRNQGATDALDQLKVLVPSFNVSTIPIDDAASLIRPANLRGLPPDNTLLLVNGRRTVQHPISNSGDETTYNANAIPVFGLERVNLLLDGAASIYGSDAVAGVVDLVMPSNLENGGGIKLNYGKVTDGHREDVSLDGYFGSDFAQGRGNVSVLYGFSRRTSQLNSDAWFTATDGRRAVGDGTSVPDPNGTSGFSTRTPWGHFETYAGGRRTGSWYVNPATGALSSGTVPTRYHYDSAAEPGITTSPAIRKGNVFASGRFDLTDSVELFGELAYYRASSESWVSSESGFGGDGFLLHIRPDAYWVPESLRGAEATGTGKARCCTRVRAARTRSRAV